MSMLSSLLYFSHNDKFQGFGKSLFENKYRSWILLQIIPDSGCDDNFLGFDQTIDPFNGKHKHFHMSTSASIAVVKSISEYNWIFFLMFIFFFDYNYCINYHWRFFRFINRNIKEYSIKQNPQGVFFTLSRPMTIRLMSPHLPKSSWICSSVV